MIPVIDINEQIIFFALQKLFAKRIEFHKSYQCGIMSEITLNITLHCLTEIDSYDISFHNDAYDKNQSTNHYLSSAEI